MRRWPILIGWILTAAAGIAAAVAVFPRAFAFYPESWTVTRQRAIEIAREGFPKLGEAVDDPYVVVELHDNVLLEHQMRRVRDRDALLASPLAELAHVWRVTVYKPGAVPGEWTYRSTVSPSGKLTSLELNLPREEEAEPIDSARARGEADRFLADMGFDLTDFEEPTERRVDREARTDLTMRYRDRRGVLGDDVPYGVEVTFAGDRLTGFDRWVDDPQRAALLESFQVTVLLSNAWIMVPFLLFVFVAVPFLRRYHAGEIGVRRAVQVFAIAFAAGVLHLALAAVAATENVTWGPLSRQQVTWAWTIQLSIFWFPTVSLLAALAWSVGEARCREGWGHKLAAFDALFQRRWRNGTVARSALRGFALGMALPAFLLLVLVALRPLGVEGTMGFLFGPWWHHAAWPGLTLTLFSVMVRLYIDLFALLFLLPWAVRRFGTWPAAALAAAAYTFLFWPPIATDGFWFLLFGALRAAALVAIFLRYDLLTALVASIGSEVVIQALPFLLADAPFLVVQGLLPLAAMAAPLALSARYLRSHEEFVYRWEDVPPHVRRIAERERHRVELETARRIQSSILPELPPQLAGIELAHCYLPATEVGGDFYDVLALDDGRLAVAVGDVAGHGVSSGLIMSMAKSTLALQVTVDPDVEAVLTTLNRTVYQSARLRLLTTLCYALVDRTNLDLTWASAGHLGPYRIDAEGRVEGLIAESYPLGVRGSMSVTLRKTRLAPGDRLFLYSDGVVEARREADDEIFGFARLEESLRRHAGKSVEGLRDGVLEDVERFTGGGERDDDQTILVLRLP